VGAIFLFFLQGREELALLPPRNAIIGVGKRARTCASILASATGSALLRYSSLEPFFVLAATVYIFSIARSAEMSSPKTLKFFNDSILKKLLS